MNSNINFIMQMLQNSNSPEQLAMNILQQQASNPIYYNLLILAKNNDTKGIENIVRNMAKEKGVDYDSALKQFIQTLGFRG